MKMKIRLSILLCIVLMFGIMPMAYAGMGGTAPTHDPKYLPYAEVGPLSEGLAMVSRQGKDAVIAGYIDKTGKEIMGFVVTGDGFEVDGYNGTPFSDGLAVVSDGGQGAFYFVKNPLTSSTPDKNPAANETRIEIAGSKGSYFTVTNVIAQENAGDESMYVANAPVTITFHGDDLSFENIATIPDYQRVPFGVKKYTNSDRHTVLDELVQQPDASNDHLYVTGNYATITKPGDYGIYAAPKGTSSTSMHIHVTQGQAEKESTGTDNPGTTMTTPTASKVLVNGKQISFEAYNIAGNNYFKLRDIAMTVNGTEKQFEVSWDSAKNAISLKPGIGYTPASGELAVSDTPTSKAATPTISKIYFDGKEVQLTAYNIGGNNYFKLRDIARLLNIGVTWDETSSSIGIDTNLNYKEE
jgi:hypothetical protein